MNTITFGIHDVTAAEHGMNPDIAERVYRAMIAGFIDYEMQEHREGRA